MSLARLRLASLLAPALALTGCGEGPAPYGNGGAATGAGWSQTVSGPCIGCAFQEGDTTVISGGVVSPQCLVVGAETTVHVVNHDPRPYTFTLLDYTGAPPMSFEAPAEGRTSVGPFGAGARVWSFFTPMLPGACLYIKTP